MSAMGKRRLVSLGILVSALSTAPLGNAQPAIVEGVVSFTVQNINRSVVPCASDGATYTVHGVLAAPSTELSDTEAAVTVYLPGTDDSQVWRFDAVPGLNTIREMAALGHASLTLDPLGFGSSGTPPGDQVCLGSIADTVHQAIGALRAGTYLLDGVPGPRFSRIALSGLSGGGVLSWIEATSFHDVDALIPVGAVHAAGSEVAVEVIPYLGRTILECRLGRNIEKRPGGPGGYVKTFRAESELAPLLYNTEPAVLSAFFAGMEPSPCGYVGNVGQAILITAPLMATLQMPVLSMMGDHDVATSLGSSVEPLLMPANPDATVVVLPNTGHCIMIGRTAPLFRATLASWLEEGGL